MFKTFEQFNDNTENKPLNEDYIGKKGKERVRKFLYKVVDKYLEGVDEMSDDASDDFFVRDMAKWYKEEDPTIK